MMSLHISVLSPAVNFKIIQAVFCMILCKRAIRAGLSVHVGFSSIIFSLSSTTVFEFKQKRRRNEPRKSNLLRGFGDRGCSSR